MYTSCQEPQNQVFWKGSEKREILGKEFDVSCAHLSAYWGNSNLITILKKDKTVTKVGHSARLEFQK